MRFKVFGRGRRSWKLSIFKRALFLLLLLFFTLLTGCSSKNTEKNELYLKNLGSGDAKFAFNNQIFTSKNNKLTAFNLENKTEKTFNITSNWIDCLKEEQVIVYSNGDKQTKVCQIGENNTIILDHLIIDDGNLHIDPAIVKIDQTYYLSSTKILGNVNVSDPNIENGQYTVQLYKSNDLKNWTYLKDIVSYQSNIEDTSLVNDNHTLRLIFEKETFDKSNSSLYQIESSDNGMTWENEKQLIPSNADNEPATFRKNDTSNQYELYYSSDIENPGKSYAGASAYLAIFDPQLNLIATQKIATNPTENLLLYDTIEKEGNLLFLFAEDYLGENNLVVQAVGL